MTTKKSVKKMYCRMFQLSLIHIYKDAGWLIMNGNRIQIKRRQFEKVIDKLDAI